MEFRVDTQLKYNPPLPSGCGLAWLRGAWSAIERLESLETYSGLSQVSR